MRKRLKKLCIAAAALAALGVILCVVAFVGSKKAGTELFSQTENEDGNYVYNKSTSKSDSFINESESNYEYEFDEKGIR